MSLGGIFLRFGGIFLRVLQFISSIICVGIYAYFVAVIRDAGYRVNDWTGAVLGISSAAAVYTLFGVVFTLCLGGNMVFGNLAILLDIAFLGAFIFVAYATRAARHSCNGYVITPLGAGSADANTGLYFASDLHRACQFESVVFAFAIILCILFFFSAIWQFWIVRHREDRKVDHRSKV